MHVFVNLFPPHVIAPLADCVVLPLRVGRVPQERKIVQMTIILLPIGGRGNDECVYKVNFLDFLVHGIRAIYQ